ncbi:rSAM-modified peptide [Flavobacterium cupreum]|uniref:RSAM-modified peptide n=1 Tax=Flavobacterium cupreum TaxID=2133766 RepID=A0A434A0V9_9FLAO|nr:rSAM-modified peptide [Flavobacterium cupreum]RUT68020.1 rSAM-modified peptide [Flavobacterium cupreum]
MTKKKLKFEDFDAEKLSANQQKKVLGGNIPEEEKDPVRGSGGNNNGNG